MANINKGEFLGRLGQDAKLGTTGKTPVANFNIANNYGRKDAEGKYPVQWIKCALFGPRAESLAQYLVTGTQVIVWGPVELETYEKDGKSFTNLKVTVDDIQLIGGDKSAEGGSAPKAAAKGGKPKVSNEFSFDDDDENGPF